MKAAIIQVATEDVLYWKLEAGAHQLEGTEEHPNQLGLFFSGTITAASIQSGIKWTAQLLSEWKQIPWLGQVKALLKQPCCLR